MISSAGDTEVTQRQLHTITLAQLCSIAQYRGLIFGVAGNLQRPSLGEQVTPHHNTINDTVSRTQLTQRGDVIIR